jgi:hypothetical protein
MLSLPLELMETGVNAQTAPTPGRNQTKSFTRGALIANVSLGLTSKIYRGAGLMMAAMLDSSNSVQDGTTLFGHQSLEYIEAKSWRLELRDVAAD